MSDNHRSLAEATASAQKRGCVVLQPKPNELFVDIDDDVSSRRLNQTFKAVEEFFGIKSFKETPSPSGGPHRKHVTIVLDQDIDDIWRAHLQGILGDDPKRAILNMRRVRNNEEAPILFFEKPKEELPANLLNGNVPNFAEQPKGPLERLKALKAPSPSPIKKTSFSKSR